MATTNDENAHSPLDALNVSQQENIQSKLSLREDLQNMSREKLEEHIRTTNAKFYSEPLKPIQMETVVSLVRGKHTFTLAGTGFGKTRIGEVYYRLFPAYKKPIVIVLNSLDSLGDNQVLEKKAVNIKAVNLTKMNLTPEIEAQVIRGDFGFVYLSPEVLLNNGMFRRMFFDRKFQSKLVLTVIDEAHMVYVWGLVASGLGKKISSHMKIQDRGIFRPSYGDLGARLLATYGVPILLLSATRPEIRLVRVPM